MRIERTGELETAAGTDSQAPLTVATGDLQGPTPSPALALSPAPDLLERINIAGHSGTLS